MTGALVPDEAAQVPQWKYVNPRQAVWPRADFIVGNPPFIGASTMRAALGDGYVQALRAAWPKVPESADFVMYWWSSAASLVASGRARCFGLITTNSLRQTFNRRVVQAALGSEAASLRGGDEAGVRGAGQAAALMKHPKSGSSLPRPPAAVALAFAIPDHPWVDSANGAAVRIAMTVAARAGNVANLGSDPSPQGAGSDPNFAAHGAGRLLTVTAEQTGEFGEVAVTLAERSGVIHADLSIGANVAPAVALRANEELSNRGVQLFGAGFIVIPQEAAALLPLPLGEGRGEGAASARPIIRDYRNGRDLTDPPRGVKVIDLFGLTAEQVREQFPAVYQLLLERVKPERDQNNRASYRDNWWLHGEPRKALRTQLAGLPRYIATVETAKHRTFQFLDAIILPDNKLIAIALDDAFHLGVLSSRTHVDWALAAGSWLGVGNDPVYVKSRCFETFPFPDDDTGLTPELRERIGLLAEQIDVHRKCVLVPLGGGSMADFGSFMRPSARPPAAQPQASTPQAPALAASTLPASTGQAQAKPKEPPGKPLTLTGLYNVLEALREGRPLTAREKAIHTQGLVGVLKDLHDELDAAVLAAYGWALGTLSAPATDELLGRLVALNAQRAAQEALGHIHWLRPAFQNPAAAALLLNKELEAIHHKGCRPI